MPQNEWICLMKFVLNVIVICRRGKHGSALKAQSAVKIHRTFSCLFIDLQQNLRTQTDTFTGSIFTVRKVELVMMQFGNAANNR